ncbi:MAG TPA: acyl-CoA dehydrogenase family protein [Acidimicrobiia bacterium]|jgi:alkylation response protein AidB-like acyl-CoA dehydrogenase
MPDTRGEFETHVREWFAANAPTKGGSDDFSNVHIVSAATEAEYRERERHAVAVTRSWQERLFDAGLAGRSWPEACGGHGAPAWQDDVVAAEQARYGVSNKMFAVGLEMLPAVLFAHGTDDQRTRHLPGVLRAQEIWCQLLSEPDAGSDLGGVRTLAQPVGGGGWTVTGQKVWTSGAGVADFALLIARSDPASSRQAGLSCFGLDMSEPGVTVRPLRQMSGAYHFNEVFLDGVFVPEDALIGNLGDGWSVLRTMLTSERAAIGGGTSARAATQLVDLARRLGRGDDPVVRQLVIAAIIRERVLDLLGSRVAVPGTVPAGGSASKLLYSEHARLTADAATRIIGAAATLVDDVDGAPWVDRLLFAPGLRIGGGTDEIQRNTIGEQGLGLPREPKTRA